MTELRSYLLLNCEFPVDIGWLIFLGWYSIPQVVDKLGFFPQVIDLI